LICAIFENCAQLVPGLPVVAAALLLAVDDVAPLLIGVGCGFGLKKPNNVACPGTTLSLFLD
jgi:hypothetical protein